MSKTKFEKLSIVEFKKRDRTGNQLYVYFGEIPNDPSHCCVVLGLNDNKLYISFKTTDFKLV